MSQSSLIWENYHRTNHAFKVVQPSKRFKENSSKTLSPKCRVVLKEVSNNSALQAQDSLSRTPPKVKQVSPDDPGTPSSNFKMLSSVAASLDYVEDLDLECYSSPDIANTMLYGGAENSEIKCSRKTKSLSSICERFLSRYPADPPDNIELSISVDDVCTELGIGRRRVYDMVNVLESIDMLRKIGKSKYLYMGKKNLATSVEKLHLKARALSLKKVVESATRIEDNDEKFSQKFWEEKDMYFLKTCDDCAKKQNLLGLLSQNFIMLCVASKEPISISLNVAAHLLSGSGQKADKNCVQFKTKIRRLYDIANILTTVGLIEKGSSKKKPSFRYKGPSLASFESSEVPTKENFCCMSFCGELKVTTPKEISPKKAFQKRKSDPCALRPIEKESKPFVRHSSLQDVCAVAEIERKKLFEEESSQEDASPKKNSDHNFQTKTLYEQNMLHHATMQGNRINNSSNHSIATLPKSIKTRIVIKEPPGTSSTQKVANKRSMPYARKIMKNKPNMHIVTKLVEGNTNKPSSMVSSHKQQSKAINFLVSDNHMTPLVCHNIDSKLKYDSPRKILEDIGQPESQSDGRFVPEKSASNSRTTRLLEDSSSFGFSNLNFSILDSHLPLSPLSIPSGYATPNISHLSNPVFLSTQSVAELLNHMEYQDENSMPLNLVKHVTESHDIPVDLTTKVGKRKFQFDDSCSNDITNQEVKAIFEQLEKEPGTSENNNREYLIDEKTIYIPITAAFSSSRGTLNMDSENFSTELSFANSFKKAKIL